MFQAIVTKYFGPTNHRGARVKASAQAGSLTIPWDHALNSDQNHENAAVALAKKYGWLNPRTYDGGTFLPRLHGGGMPDGRGNVFVLIEERMV